MCEAGETPRRLFLDDYHIQSMTGLSRVPPAGQASRAGHYAGQALGDGANLRAILKYDQRCRMVADAWALPHVYNAGDYWMPCYAESADGLTWTKPVLNLSGTNFDGSGSKSNNIIDLGYAPNIPMIRRSSLSATTSTRTPTAATRRWCVASRRTRCAFSFPPTAFGGSGPVTHRSRTAIVTVCCMIP